MPVTLRGIPNPSTDTAILTALATVLPGYPTPNTLLAASSASQTGAEVVYVQREFDLLNTAVYPAVLLMAGRQTHKRKSDRTYDGSFVAIVDYYDAWEQRTDEFDTIRANINTDLFRMEANVMENESLAVGAQQPLTVSALSFDFSPYEGFFRTFNGVELIYRRMTILFNVLEFDQ
jgi:hypothetical protein